MRLSWQASLDITKHHHLKILIIFYCGQNIKLKIYHFTHFKGKQILIMFVCRKGVCQISFLNTVSQRQNRTVETFFNVVLSELHVTHFALLEVCHHGARYPVNVPI